MHRHRFLVQGVSVAGPSISAPVGPTGHFTSSCAPTRVALPPFAVLSAVSGLRVAVPSLSQQLIVGLAVLVLLLVFALQKYGTGQVGRCACPLYVHDVVEA